MTRRDLRRDEWADFRYELGQLIFDLSPVALVAAGCFLIAFVGHSITNT
jgi:hypothetical protein